MTPAFKLFSVEHLVTVVVGFAVIAIILLCGRRGGSLARGTTVALALLNLASYPVCMVAAMMQSGTLKAEDYLPFHLCDVAAIAAGIALLTKHPLAATMTYFWGLAGTIQGLLTPAITVGFPGPVYLAFFLQHFAIVAAALYLPIVQGWRPRRPLWKAVAEIFAWSVGYLLFALLVNAPTGLNFGYASHPPVNPSLLDHLGPWPWYLLSVQGVAVILYTVLCLPFVRTKEPS